MLVALSIGDVDAGLQKLKNTSFKCFLYLNYLPIRHFAVHEDFPHVKKKKKLAR